MDGIRGSPRVSSYTDILKQRYLTGALFLVACFSLTSCEFDEIPKQDHINNRINEDIIGKQRSGLTHDINMLNNSTDATTPQQGSHNIVYSDSSILIVANQAYELNILNALAKRANLELIDQGASWKEVTLTIEADNLHEVLDILLQEHTYNLVYNYNHNLQTDSLSQVIIEAPPGSREVEIASFTISPVANNASANQPELQDGNSDNLSYEDQIYLTQLLDPSTAVRAEAAANIQAEGFVLEYLEKVIISDPSPEVRSAATSSLEDSEDPRAVDALILGLNDSNSMVVTSIIESLEYIGDRRAIPHLEILVNHDNQDIREAATSALNSLQ